MYFFCNDKIQCLLETYIMDSYSHPTGCLMTPQNLFFLWSIPSHLSSPLPSLNSHHLYSTFYEIGIFRFCACGRLCAVYLPLPGLFPFKKKSFPVSSALHKMTWSHPFSQRKWNKCQMNISTTHVYCSIIHKVCRQEINRSFLKLVLPEFFLTKWINPGIMAHTTECHELIQTV